MKKTAAMICAVCFLFACLPAFAQSISLTPTAEWEPPVIDESCADTEPWLLVLKIAQEELGYIEGPLNDQSKYGSWFSGRRTAWCAEFLTWCVNEADTRYGTSLLRNVYPWYGMPSEGAPWFMEKGRFISDNGKIPVTNEKQWLIGVNEYLEDNSYIPSPGDYMWIFYYSRKKGTDHVTIVEGVSQDADGTIQIHVIEGNNPDRVQRAVYPIDSPLIYGFGTPVKRAYTNIRMYCTGDDVIQLQEDLETLGYYKIPKSGCKKQVDSSITSAIKRFRVDHGLSSSQVFDMDARKAMEKELDYAEITLQ